MGVDKPNVRFVLHSEPSDSVDSYYQEIGRAGRDGEPADAVLFYRAEDLGLRRFFAGGGDSEERREWERSRVEMMRGYAEHDHCRRAFVLSYFGEPAPDPCGNCDNCEAGRGRADEGARPFEVGARVTARGLGRGRRAALRRGPRRGPVRVGRLPDAVGGARDGARAARDRS